MNVTVNLQKHINNSYTIFLGDLPSLAFNNKVAIVTNPTISDLHLARLLERITAPKVSVVTIPDGEEYKNLATLETILDRLFEERIDRSSLLIAFGGGVIGDMTGFAASIYERGISFIQIPTTLLSMVDASVGGKTGINNRFGKNLLGSFYQPKTVYIDPYWLKTLPKREFAAGVAEIIKMAVTLDREFFIWLENADMDNPSICQEAITRSIKIKADIVTQDEKENGLRQVLNYGHTFAHVIERETDYKRYLHGECVAMGMTMANNLAVLMGYLSAQDANRVKNLLKKHDLPVMYAPQNAELFYESFFLDKKSRDGKILFVLPRSIGDYAFVVDAKKEWVLEAIKGE
ncbi:MAG: 3-dehydroquinate synthase [Helicobacteraceae bacterium]|jgi:3-dehydroquinate synthase|nr:3-dehydroquinate synthase [Helicobacteraceae bacterium]